MNDIMLENLELPTRLCVFCVLYVYVCVRACDMYVNYAVYITIQHTYNTMCRYTCEDM